MFCRYSLYNFQDTQKNCEISLSNGNDLVLTGFKKNEKNKYGKIIFDK